MNSSRAGRPPGQQGAELLDTARHVFLEHGFDATTTSAIAARAGISKSSLYREHESKSALFVAVIADWTNRGREAMRPHLLALADSTDVEHGLRQFATVLSSAILSPDVSAMRRLVAAEARRFPDTAARYLETSWQANIDALADTLATMTDRGLINADDSTTAADQLVWLTVGRDLNAATITGEHRAPAIDDQAEKAVRTFLARYAR